MSLLVQLNVGVIGFSFRLMLLLDPPLGGDEGGGMTTAEGSRALGVVRDGRPPPKLFGVPIPIARFAGLGVTSEPLFDGLIADLKGLADTIRDGLLNEVAREGLANAPPRADSCDAVTPMYLLALLPAVILLIADAEGVVATDTVGARGLATDFGRAAGVAKPKPAEGVTRPLDRGVARPLYDGALS